MEKKNTGLIVLVVILTLLVVGLSSFIIYDKNMIDDNTKSKETSTHQENESAIEYQNEEKSENDYQSYANNLKEEYSKYDSNNYSYQYIENDIISDGYEIYLKSNGSLYVKYYNEEFAQKYGEYKIADNVLSFYVINTGQDVGNTLYFINIDGTVGKADTEYGVAFDGNLTINNDIGYKNIVTILNGLLDNTHGPIFIDINGNILN